MAKTSAIQKNLKRIRLTERAWDLEIHFKFKYGFFKAEHKLQSYSEFSSNGSRNL